MIAEHQQQEKQVTFVEDRTVYLPRPYTAEVFGVSNENRSERNGGQPEKFHPQGVRRLYRAIINRAILDVLENGQESPGAERWLLSRDFDKLQAAFD